MSLKVDVDFSGLDRVLREEPKKVDQWLAGVAETMVSDIKLKFGTGPAGKTYTRGPKNKKGAKTHIASSPGAPPNVDIGTLRASIRQEPAGRFTRHIVAGTVYAEYLENGTAHMAARPFMRPVFDDWNTKIEDDAKRNLSLE